MGIVTQNFHRTPDWLAKMKYVCWRDFFSISFCLLFFFLALSLSFSLSPILFHSNLCIQCVLLLFRFILEYVCVCFIALLFPSTDDAACVRNAHS